MAHFRVRYATFNGRFCPCSIVDGVHRSDDVPTAFPQNTGRLEHLISHGKMQESEDSFFLDIWTPETAGKKPVLFWIHGGAFVAGASGDPQNDAAALAKNADVVVVSPTYRIGILGTAYFPGIPQQNCGFHDIATALEWTSKWIPGFGGDASAITVGGQSSGAWYAMAMHTSPRLQHLFKKTMLFSWPGAMKTASLPEAEEIYHRFCREMKKISPAHTSIDTAPMQVILQAQETVGRQNKKKYNYVVPLMPSFEEGYIAANFFEAAKRADKELYLQYTEHECGSYTYSYPIGKRFPAGILTLLLRKYCPALTVKETRQRIRNSRSAYKAMVEITSEAMFKQPTQAVAESCGATVHEFSFPTPPNKTMCCHCFDLPFIFGSFDAWKNSRILAGCDEAAMKKESLRLQKQIGEFLWK